MCVHGHAPQKGRASHFPHPGRARSENETEKRRSATARGGEKCPRSVSLQGVSPLFSSSHLPPPSSSSFFSPCRRPGWLADRLVPSTYMHVRVDDPVEGRLTCRIKRTGSVLGTEHRHKSQPATPSECLCRKAPSHRRRRCHSGSREDCGG